MLNEVAQGERRREDIAPPFLRGNKVSYHGNSAGGEVGGWVEGSPESEIG